MELKQRLREDLKQAMRQGDGFRRDTLRMLLAAVKQVEVDERADLDEEAVLAVVARQAKQRRESIADAQKAGRLQMARDEQAELTIIESYLPQMLSRDEVQAIVSETIHQLGVSGVKSMGPVMGAVMPQLRGKADGRLISQVVRELLESGQ